MSNPIDNQRYKIEHSEIPGKWVVTDQENLIVCIFEQGKFNDTQEFTMLEDFDSANYMKLAALMRQMGDYLTIHHADKI